MKYTVRKLFWDYEKEEAWLNGMSSKGLMLTDYSWCRYVFAEGSPNEYTYRIELLDQVPTHPESMAYIRFLEQNGIECVATYMRWVFLRRKSSEGAFDIYSDLKSKVRHYQRVHVLWTSLMTAELVVGLGNLVIGMILNTKDGLGHYSYVNLFLGSFLLALGLFFWKLGVPLRKKIKKLKQEMSIQE